MITSIPTSPTSTPAPAWSNWSRHARRRGRSARQRRDRLDLARVGEPDVPAHDRELVAHPDRAAHRLDAPADLLVGADRQGQPGQAVVVGGDRALAQRAVLV